MEAKLMFQILMLTGFLWISMSRPGSDDQFASLLRTVADDHMGDVNNLPPDSVISGPNGYCIDIRKGRFINGNPIILWECIPDQVNQQWTYRNDDRTIRAKGGRFCLITTGFDAGSRIVLHDCYGLDVNEKAFWDFLSGGLIRNLESGLVLTAFPPTAETGLTIQPNTYSSYQTWQVNYTRPILASIVGLNGLCLQETDDKVWITDCDSTNDRQRWFLYPDGSIRPKHKTNGCLSYTSLTDPIVGVLTCWLGPSSQRWVYTSSRNFFAERVNLNLAVKLGDPSLKQIIVFTPNDQPNQKWEIRI